MGSAAAGAAVGAARRPNVGGRPPTSRPGWGAAPAASAPPAAGARFAAAPALVAVAAPTAASPLPGAGTPGAPAGAAWGLDACGCGHHRRATTRCSPAVGYYQCPTVGGTHLDGPKCNQYASGGASRSWVWQWRCILF